MDTDTARHRLEEERRRLEEQRRRLDETEVRDTPEHDLMGELSSYDQHPADEGTETFEKEKVLAQIEHAESQLEEVQKALARLDDGTFGRCEVCNVEIPDERLEERPAARRCVEHQREVERAVHPPAGA